MSLPYLLLAEKVTSLAAGAVAVQFRVDVIRYDHGVGIPNTVFRSAVVMGLNRFLWAFVASYPAMLCTNAAIRSQLRAGTADRITVVAAAIAVGAILLAGGTVRVRSFPALAFGLGLPPAALLRPA